MPRSASEASIINIDQHSAFAFTSTDLAALQIRAFIEASEDVDIDPETLADLMSSLPQEDTLDETTESDVDSDFGGLDLEGIPESQLELDISVLYTSPGKH